MDTRSFKQLSLHAAMEGASAVKRNLLYMAVNAEYLEIKLRWIERKLDRARLRSGLL